MFGNPKRVTCLLKAILPGAILALHLSAAPPVDFSRDVRPILSDNCFACHGPDEASRQAGLRFDIEDGPKKARGDRPPVIVPGDPEASLILKRVAPADPAMQMPPPYSDRKPLTEQEVATLRAWIEQGAKFQSLWSFNAPVKPTEPIVRNRAWVRNPIDTFILARLEKEGLSPAPEASRAQLLRRVSFDLTGLPPTLAELDAFLADTSPNAYEKTVDRLLASPRYGERMAVDWLDAARYADTHGYQTDPAKEMWPWRDWVINAFNSNMPYNRFTIEQLAGDLLPNATLDQKIATGFQRNPRINSETGAIAEEFEAETLVDRAATVGTVWMGLTVGCARCHDHKYDPITQRDFYSLAAYFNNVDEVGNGGTADGRGNYKPFLKLPSPELDAQVAAKDAELKTAREKLSALDKQLAAGQAQWEKTALTYRPKWEALTPANLKADNGVTLKALPDGSVLAGGAMPPSSIFEVTAATKMKNITAFRLELIPDAGLPDGGSGRGAGGKGVVTLFAVSAGGKTIGLTRITADFKSEESELNLVVRPAEQLKRGWGVNPEMNKPHYAVIETSRMLSPDAPTTFRIGSEYEGAPVGRFRISVTDSEYPEVVPDEMATILRAPAAERSEKDAKALTQYFVSHPVERRRISEDIATLDAARRAAENKIPSTMVMSEMAQPRDMFILLRGAYDKPGDKVTPATPSFLPPQSANALAESFGPRAMAGGSIESAHGTSSRQSLLADVFRNRSGKNRRQFRQPGRSSQSSGTPRLARYRIHAHWLGREGDAAADRDFRGLPAVLGSDARDARARPGESSDRERHPRASACRDDSGSGARNLRPSECEDGRRFGEALSAGRPVGTAFGVSGQKAVRAFHRRGSLAQKRLQLLETDGAAALDDHLRCAHARILRRTAADQFHSAAGAGTAE